MSPIVFLPTPIPRHASVLFWLTLGGMIAVSAILERAGKPRATMLWMLIGYLIGLFWGRGDVGGLVGAVVGALLGLASARISSSRS